MAPPTLMTANCCEETELKCDKYCWTSRFEPMLLSNCTTVERVDRLLEGATAAVAFGKVRAALKGRRLAAVRALLATAPAVERMDNISNMGLEWRLKDANRRPFLQLLQSKQVVVGVPKRELLACLSHEKAGIKRG